MIYTLDTGVNLMLNAAGITGLGEPGQILVATILAAGAVAWNATRLPAWSLALAVLLISAAGAVAMYALLFGRQPTCLYAYESTKPVFSDTLDRRLSWQEVRPLDCASLWVARNEIYARSNYCFFTPVAHAYFSNDATCDPAVEQASTAIGNANIALIARMEQRKGCGRRGDMCHRLDSARSSRLDLTRPTSANDL